MKKLYLVLLVLLSMCGCVESNLNPVVINAQQREFVDIHDRNYNQHLRLGNEILKSEFVDSVKLAMGKYMDSVKLFVNWKARIWGINCSELQRNYNNIHFWLSFEGPSSCSITFEVDYILPKDSLNSDKIYNTVKNISDDSTVYFDGFIKTKANGEAQCDRAYRDYNLLLPYYDFSIVDITTSPQCDTLSTNLQNAIDLYAQVTDIADLYAQNKLSEKDFHRREKAIFSQIDKVREGLTEEEWEYARRFGSSILENFIHAK